MAILREIVFEEIEREIERAKVHKELFDSTGGGLCRN